MTAPWMIAVVVLWIVTALLTVIVLGLLRRLDATLMEMASRLGKPVAGALDVLPVGAQVPQFDAVDESGRQVHSALDMSTDPAIWLLIGGSCKECDDLIGQMVRHPNLSSDIPLVLVGDDTVQERERLGGVAATKLFQRHSTVRRAFSCNVTPFAFALDDRGRVAASDIINRVEHLYELAGLNVSASTSS